MMTNFDVLTKLWMWRSCAWWFANAAIGVYLVFACRRHVSPRNIAYFGISVAAFLIALTSPLATLASRYMFSAHMAQHLLMLLIVPLFAVLAWPASTYSIGRVPQLKNSAVPIAWMAGIGAMWFWHIPAMCNASMSSPSVFGIQQITLVAAGAAFWWPVFGPVASLRIQPHLAAAYLFAGCLGCTLLGIYITFSPVSVCPMYIAPVGSNELISLIRERWGFSYRIDQQVGGLLMWVPACMIYLGAILASLKSWYHVPGQNLISISLGKESPQ